jgi:hypothetical protein
MPPTTLSDENFWDRFALLLVIELLGTDRVLEHLQCITAAEHAVGSSSPLYWRSKLMLQDPACLLTGDLDAITNPVWFLDIVFQFVKQNGSDDTTETKIDLAFGFLLLESSPTKAQYFATKPLEKRQLEAHISSLQLDPLTVTADSLATTMAKELLRQGAAQTENCAVTVNRPTSSSIDVMIPYLTMGSGTRGALTLQRDADKCAAFDAASLRLLYWDWVRNTHCGQAKEKAQSSADKKSRNGTPDSSLDQVMLAYETWQKKALPKKITAVSSPKAAASPGCAMAVADAAPALAAVGKNTLAAKRRLKGMGGFGAGRKRKKGPVFQNSSDDDSE